MANIQDIFAPKAGDRYIILGEKAQELPKRIKVSTYEIKESSGGKQFVELKCVDDDGTKLTVSVFQRDVKACVTQWGMDPVNWGWMEFELNFTGNRYFLKPAKDQFHEDD